MNLSVRRIWEDFSCPDSHLLREVELLKDVDLKDVVAQIREKRKIPGRIEALKVEMGERESLTESREAVKWLLLRFVHRSGIFNGFFFSIFTTTCLGYRTDPLLENEARFNVHFVEMFLFGHFWLHFLSLVSDSRRKNVSLRPK